MTVRIKRVIGIISLTITVLFAYAFFCKKTGLPLPCVFRLITGLKCPGCGVTRMCLSLLEFDFVSSFYYNPVIFCLLPVFAGIFFHIVYRYIKYNTLMPNKFFNVLIYVVLVLLVAFAIFRNIFGF